MCAEAAQLQLQQALIDAGLAGDVNAVQRLLAAGVNVNAQSVQGGWSALHNASMKGHESVVHLLIAANANVNLKDGGGFTALMYAATYRHVACVEALVRAGADMNARDNEGKDVSAYATAMEVRDAIARARSQTGMTGMNGASANTSANNNRFGAVGSSRGYGGSSNNGSGGGSGGGGGGGGRDGGYPSQQQQQQFSGYGNFQNYSGKGVIGGGQLQSSNAVGSIPAAAPFLRAGTNR